MISSIYLPTVQTAAKKTLRTSKLKNHSHKIAAIAGVIAIERNQTKTIIDQMAEEIPYEEAKAENIDLTNDRSKDYFACKKRLI